MLPRNSIILLLLLASLLTLGVSPRRAAAAPRVQTAECVGMACVKGCCADVVCCGSENDPQPSAPQAPALQRVYLQFAAVVTCDLPLFFTFSSGKPSFFTRDKEPGRHLPPTLATTCIWLI